MKRNWLVSIIISAALVILCVASIAQAQAGLPPTTTYTQNFDALANTGTSSTVPVGWAFSETGTGANATYTAGTGSSVTGDTYSFGSALATDRAFGSLLSGSVLPTIGVSFTNNTGGTIGRLSITYACEQWRLGATGRGTDRLDFQYSTDATSLSTGTWVNYDSLDCLAANSSGTAGALDGNLAVNRITVTAVLSNPGILAISSGANFWIRWTDFNITNSDDGLGVDDFSMNLFTPTAVTLSDLNASTSTSPAPLAFGVLGLTAVIVFLRRKVTRTTSN